MQLQKQITELQKNSQRLVKYNSQLKQENDKLKLKDLMEKDELLKRKEMKIEHFHA